MSIEDRLAELLPGEVWEKTNCLKKGAGNGQTEAIWKKIARVLSSFEHSHV